MNLDELRDLVASLRLAGPDAATVSATAAAVTALVAVAALWFAWNQVKEARAARELTQDLDIKRSQPYVVAFIEESGATQLALDLVIKNFGPTAARNVTVEIEPWPQRTGQTARDVSPVGIPELPVLAPGQEWRTLWVWTPDRDDSGLPNRHEGFVDFEGLHDEKMRTPIVLDVDIYKPRHYVQVRGVHDVAEALRDMSLNQKKWTEGLNGPLSVLTRDGHAKDEREAKLAAEFRRRRAEADARVAENDGAADTPS